MLSNAYFLAKFRFDTAEHEPAKNLQNFREMHFRKFENSASASRPGAHARGAAPSAGDLRRVPEEGRQEQRRHRPRRVRHGGDVRERRLAKFRQNVARFRLYRLRFLQQNMRSTAVFKIYQILKLKFLKIDKIWQILRHLQFFLLKFHENCCF